jgi:hypothetical protein
MSESESSSTATAKRSADDDDVAYTTKKLCSSSDSTAMPSRMLVEVGESVAVKVGDRWENWSVFKIYNDGSLLLAVSATLTLTLTTLPCMLSIAIV